MTATAKPAVSRTRVVVVLVVLVGLLAINRGVGSSTAPAPPPAAAGLSDAAIKSAMASNLNALSSTAAIPRDAGGTPDISFSQGVLFVTTTDPASAAALCRTVAAVTNSPDTGEPLGVTNVILISGGSKVASCRP